jgi:hypothetical protein
VLVIVMPGKRFWNAIPACVILRKNFQNGVLVCSVTKVPLYMYVCTYEYTYIGTLFYDTFSVTTLYSIDDRVTNE